jgi:hypothetical protein
MDLYRPRKRSAKKRGAPISSPCTEDDTDPLFWRKYNNYPGGQVLPESLPTRIIVVEATSFMLAFTGRIFQNETTGKANQNVEPFPGTLSTPTSP